MTTKEDFHDLVEIGEESSEKKAAAMLAEKSQDEEKSIQEANAAAKEILGGEKKVWDYKVVLAKQMVSLMREIEWPAGWKWDVEPNDDGIAIMFETPRQEYYARGMRVSGDPEFDTQGIWTMKTRVENTIDRLTGADSTSPMNQTKSGIWLPEQ